MPESYTADNTVGRQASNSEAGVVSGFTAPPIPPFHGITCAHLMCRDPHSIYAYWEMTPEFREMTARHFNCTWDELPITLRLYRVDGISNEPVVFREVEATRLTDNWLFGDLIPGSTYFMDLGTRNVYDVFVALLRSNVINTPRNWPGRSTYGHMGGAWQPEAISSSFHRLG